MIAVYADKQTLAEAAAGLFVQRCRKALLTRGRFDVLLSGGETPKTTYELLGQESRRSRVDWPRVHVFWSDERNVPEVDLRSNYRLARETLLAHVPIPGENVHRIAYATDPRKTAREYEAQIRRHFGKSGGRFDVAFLGLGTDGHTASLFPGHRAASEKKRWVVSVRKPGEDFSRVTLTPPLLNRSRLIIFLVQGEGKARILRDVLALPGKSGKYPANQIRPTEGKLVWLVDAAAYSLSGGEKRMSA